MFLSFWANGVAGRSRKTALLKQRIPDLTTRPNNLATGPDAPGLMLQLLGFPSGRGSAWLERLVRDQEVGGSNPLAPILPFNDFRLNPSSRPVEA